jgi:hypothetical protein
MAITISTRDAVLKVLYHIQVKYNRTYSQVKRSTIKNLIFKIYRIDRCLSTIDYHLGTLKRDGLFNNFPQKGQDEKGRWFNKVSNRQIIGKGFNYLKMLGLNVAKYLTDWAFKGVKHKRRKDKPHFPENDISTKQPSGRSAAQFDTLENTLNNTLNRLS